YDAVADLTLYVQSTRGSSPDRSRTVMRVVSTRPPGIYSSIGRSSRGRRTSCVRRGAMPIRARAGHERREVVGRCHELRVGLHFPGAFHLTEEIHRVCGVLALF